MGYSKSLRFEPITGYIPTYILNKYYRKYIVLRDKTVILYGDTYNDVKNKLTRLVPQGESPGFYFQRKGHPFIYYVFSRTDAPIMVTNQYIEHRDRRPNTRKI